MLERERCREKYHRLKYNNRNSLYAQERLKFAKRYYRRYPEKYKAHIAISSMQTSPDKRLHHWSYNEEHHKDVIELDVLIHYKVHRYIIYDKQLMMYRTRTGEILDSKEKHARFIESIKELP